MEAAQTDDNTAAVCILRHYIINTVAPDALCCEYYVDIGKLIDAVSFTRTASG